jgi:hypothetical protein
LTGKASKGTTKDAPQVVPTAAKEAPVEEALVVSIDDAVTPGLVVREGPIIPAQPEMIDEGFTPVLHNVAMKAVE